MVLHGEVFENIYGGLFRGVVPICHLLDELLGQPGDATVRFGEVLRCESRRATFTHRGALHARAALGYPPEDSEPLATCAAASGNQPCATEAKKKPGWAFRASLVWLNTFAERGVSHGGFV